MLILSPEDFTTTRSQQTFEAKCRQLKVSLSRKVILVSSILPKNELKNFNFCPILLIVTNNVYNPTGAEMFHSFFGRIENTTLKCPFEINRPLVTPETCKIFAMNGHFLQVHKQRCIQFFESKWAGRSVRGKICPMV